MLENSLTAFERPGQGSTGNTNATKLATSSKAQKRKGERQQRWKIDEMAGCR
jgi:hypothetical protein